MATESVDDELRQILDKHAEYYIKETMKFFQNEGVSPALSKDNPGDLETLAALQAYITRECARKVLEAEQKPVGAALEIKVAPETMKAVMARIRLSDKTVADRVLEPLWRVQRWRDGSADEYDLEIEQWKLRILAHLTRRFNWAAFLLKPDNLKVLKTRAELRAAIQEVGGAK